MASLFKVVCVALELVVLVQVVVYLLKCLIVKTPQKRNNWHISLNLSLNKWMCIAKYILNEVHISMGNQRLWNQENWLYSVLATQFTYVIILGNLFIVFSSQNMNIMGEVKECVVINKKFKVRFFSKRW